MMRQISMASDGQSAPIHQSTVQRIVKRPPRTTRPIIHMPQSVEMRLGVIADSTRTTTPFLPGAPTIQNVICHAQATPPSHADVGTEFRSTRALHGALLPFQLDGPSKAHAPSITRRGSCRASSSLSWPITLPLPVRRIASLWIQSIQWPASNIRTNAIVVRDGREKWSLRVRLHTTAQCLVPEILQIRTVVVDLGGSKYTNILRNRGSMTLQFRGPLLNWL